MDASEQINRRERGDAPGPRSTVAVAESLTGGMLSSSLAAREGSSDWFMGGVVAYSRAVKENLLGIGDAPVVSEAAVRRMAEGVADRLGADYSVAVTGVGGPGPEDGIAAGTVWIAAHGPAATLVELHVFDGGPVEVCERTCEVAVAALERVLGASIGSSC